MPDRYERAFALAQQNQSKAFIPFTVLGWPDVQTSLQVIEGLIEGGATALELGLAFSDPIADGPVIQAAAHQTIESGVTVEQSLELIRQVRQSNAEIPIGLLLYYNLILSRGADPFFGALKEVGVDSVLIADLPAEFVEEVKPFADKHGIHLIFIVAPTTTAQRLEKIARHAGGYLYLVSRLGITGVEERYDESLQRTIAMTKKMISLPVCVGFGISEPGQARQMIELGADGVITGSKIIKLISECDTDAMRATLIGYVRTMCEAVSTTGTYGEKITTSSA